MKDLIPIQQNDDGSIAVSGRSLHAGLDVSTRYNDWFARMVAYGFTDGEDFYSLLSESSGGRPSTDHVMTLDMAKEIAMIQRSERGQQVRRYFIEAEKRLRTQHPAKLTRSDLARMVLAAEEEKAALAAIVAEQRPAMDYHNRFIAEQDDIITVDNFAGQYGSTGPKVRELLADSGLAARKLIGKRWSESKKEMEKVYEWRARQGLPSSEWFDLRPQHNVKRLHNGQVRQTLYVRQYYAEQLAVKLGLAQPAFAIPA